MIHHVCMIPQRPHSRIHPGHGTPNSNSHHDASGPQDSRSRGFANIKNGLVTCAHVHDHAIDPLRCSRPRYCSSFLFASLPIPIASKNRQDRNNHAPMLLVLLLSVSWDICTEIGTGLTCSVSMPCRRRPLSLVQDVNKLFKFVLLRFPVFSLIFDLAGRSPCIDTLYIDLVA